MRAVLVVMGALLLLIAAAVICAGPVFMADDGTVVCVECDCGVVHDAPFAKAGDAVQKGSGELVYLWTYDCTKQIYLAARPAIAIGARAQGSVLKLPCHYGHDTSMPLNHRRGNLNEVEVLGVGVRT